MVHSMAVRLVVTKAGLKAAPMVTLMADMSELYWADLLVYTMAAQ